MCDEKSRAFVEGGKRRKKRAGGRERRTREQLREDEHEYAGLVLRAREDEGREETIAREGEGATKGERDGRKKEGEREREIGGGGPFALF